MFDIHKVLNDCSNQFLLDIPKSYPQHGLGLAQCEKRMSSVPSACCYTKIITRGINNRLGHDEILLILNLFTPDQFGLEFPFDHGSSLLTMFSLVFCAASSDLDHDKFIISTLRNSCSWVDTGQRRNFYGFLLVKSRENVIEEKIQRVLQEFTGCYSKQSPYILVDRVVTLLCAMFGIVSKSRTALQYIHFNRGQFLDCGAFPLDSVVNHFLVSLCTNFSTLPATITFKITFSNLILDILTQVEQSAEIAHDFDFDGLVIVGGVDSKTNAHLYAANLSSKPQSTAVALAAKLKLVIFSLVS